MKYLKINTGRGFFCLDPSVTTPDWKDIDQITKDDLMSLLDSALAADFDMDPFDEVQLGHKAHQIIYKRIHAKFNELLQQKSRFEDEIGNTFKSALEKYAATDNDGSIPATPAVASAEPAAVAVPPAAPASRIEPQDEQ